MTMSDLNDERVDLDEAIRDYQRLFPPPYDLSPNLILARKFRDALEAAEAERDEWRTEHGIVKERSSTRFQAYQQKKRELRAMEIERDKALAKIARVEALHLPAEHWGPRSPESMSDHAFIWQTDRCVHCDADWPCETIAALTNGEPL